MRVFASVANANLAARRLLRATNDLDGSMSEARRGTLEFAKAAFIAAAPEDTSRLKRGITIKYNRAEGYVHANPVDPDSGFRYVAVTRFGHRARIIRPVKARRLRFPYPGHAGPIQYRMSVRGFHPTTDWVAAEKPGIKKSARERMDRVGADFLRKASS